VITHLLKRMGYTCDIAEDGLVAVEKAQRKRYDLILCINLSLPPLCFNALTLFPPTAWTSTWSAPSLSVLFPLELTVSRPRNSRTWEDFKQLENFVASSPIRRSDRPSCV
jgi:hypothetical protein